MAQPRVYRNLGKAKRKSLKGANWGEDEVARRVVRSGMVPREQDTRKREKKRGGGREYGGLVGKVLFGNTGGGEVIY